MIPPEREEQIAAWVDGLLSTEETREIESWFQQHPQAHQHAQTLRQLRTLLNTRGSVSAPKHLKQQILDQLPDAKGSNRKKWRRYTESLSIAAVALLVVVAAIERPWQQETSMDLSLNDEGSPNIVKELAPAPQEEAPTPSAPQEKAPMASAPSKEIERKLKKSEAETHPSSPQRAETFSSAPLPQTNDADEVKTNDADEVMIPNSVPTSEIAKSFDVKTKGEIGEIRAASAPTAKMVTSAVPRLYPQREVDWNALLTWAKNQKILISTSENSIMLNIPVALSESASLHLQRLGYPVRNSFIGKIQLFRVPETP